MYQSFKVSAYATSYKITIFKGENVEALETCLNINISVTRLCAEKKISLFARATAVLLLVSTF